MTSELVKILGECDDNSSTLEHILSDPLAKQIHAGTYNPTAAADYNELYEALKQASYLSVDARSILTEIVDRIGADSKTFNATYVKTNLPEHLEQLYLSISDCSEDYVQDSTFLHAYEPRSGINHFFARELRLHYGEPPYTAAKLRRLPIPASIAATIDVELLQKVMSVPIGENNCEIAISAIYADRADCLKFIWSKFGPDSKIPRLLVCLKHDSITCFRFLSEQKNVDMSIEPSEIFEYDAVNIFNYMLDRKQLAVCINDAIEYNAVKCIIAMIQREYRLTEDEIVEASKHIECRVEVFDGLEEASKRIKYNVGVFEVLVKAKTFPLQNPQIVTEIIEASSVRALEMVISEYKEVPEAAMKKIRTSRICECLCKHGHIPTLRTIKYLVRHREVLETALRYYVAANGVDDIDSSLCELIAKHQSLETLQLAHELGCPWDQGTLIAAISNPNMELFRYAIENGCPHDVETLLGQVQKGSLIDQYLRLVYPKLQ